MRCRLFLLMLFGAVFIACSGRGEATPNASGAIVDITTAPGEAVRFEPAEPSVAFASSITLTLRNGSTQAHNLVFTEGVEAATRTIVEPGDWDRIGFEVPGPGVYQFVCTIHEDMRGSLTVEAPTSVR